MRTRVPGLRPFGALLLLAFLFASCGDGSVTDPNDPGDPGQPGEPGDPGGGDPVTLDCGELGFACTPSEVPTGVMERSDELLAEGTDRLGSGQTVAQVAAWLQEQEGMRMVLTGDHALMFLLDGGVPVALYDAIAATRDGSSSASAAVATAAEPPARTVVGDGTPRENPARRKKALILSPFEWEYQTPDAGRSVEQILGSIEDYMHQGGVEYRENDAVGVAEFSGWGSYDVVLLNTHGGTLSGTDSRTGNQVTSSFFVTGIEVPKCAELYMDAYRGTTGIGCTGVSVRYENFVGNAADEFRNYITVWGNFFTTYYADGLDVAVLVINACKSYVTDFLPRRMAGSSSNVFGWTNDVLASFGSTAIPRLFTELAKGRSAKEAYDEVCSGGGCVDAGGKGATLQRFGAGDDLRIRDIPRLVTPFAPSSSALSAVASVAGPELAVQPTLPDGSPVPFLGQAGDGVPDDLLFVIEVDGVEPGREGEFTVRALVDGQEKGAWSLDSERATRVADLTMRLRESAPLGFDVETGRAVEVKLEVDLPEGGTSESTVSVILANPVLEVRSMIQSESPDDQVVMRSEVEATIELSFEDDPAAQKLEMAKATGDLGYASFTIQAPVPGGCSMSTDTHDGTMDVVDGEIDFESPAESGFGVPEELVITFEGIRETWTVSCSHGSDTFDFIHWFAGFVVFHGGELGGPNEFDESKGGMVVTGWTSGNSEDVYARRTYERSATRDGLTIIENTTMEIKGPRYPDG